MPCRQELGQVEQLFSNYHVLNNEVAVLTKPIEKRGRYRNSTIKRMAEVAIGAKTERDNNLSLLLVSSPNSSWDNKRYTQLFIANAVALAALRKGISVATIHGEKMGLLHTHFAVTGAFPIDSLSTDDIEYPKLMVDVLDNDAIELRDRSRNGTWIYADWKGVDRIPVNSPIAEYMALPENGATVIHLVPEQRNRLS